MASIGIYLNIGLDGAPVPESAVSPEVVHGGLPRRQEQLAASQAAMETVLAALTPHGLLGGAKGVTTRARPSREWTAVMYLRLTLPKRALDRLAWRERVVQSLVQVSRDLNQDCIALYVPACRRGWLIGDRAAAWGVFDHSRFLRDDGAPLPEDSPPVASAALAVAEDGRRYVRITCEDGSAYREYTHGRPPAECLREAAADYWLRLDACGTRASQWNPYAHCVAQEAP